MYAKIHRGKAASLIVLLVQQEQRESIDKNMIGILGLQERTLTKTRSYIRVWKNFPKSMNATLQNLHLFGFFIKKIM
ncbi:hypothetical protein CUMW_083450 [Citrus unshiu]|nr:hypothetical protein CUMW_083450 [Citrus unshiu]